MVLGQVAAAIGSLVLVRVVTGYLNPEQYGQLSLALTLGTLVCQVAMAGVVPGIMRYFTIAREKGDLPGYFKAAVKLMGYGTLATAALGALLLGGAAVAGWNNWLLPIALAIVLLQLTNFNGILSSIQNSARQRQIVALHSGIDPWLRIALVVAVFALAGSNEATAIVGYAAASLLVLLSQAFFARRLVPQAAATTDEAEQRMWLGAMWAYSQPFVLFNIFTWAQSSSDRWALQAYVSTHDVGLYSALMQLGFTPITIVIGLLTSFVGPILNQRSGDATDHKRNANVHRISWLLTGLCLALTVIAVLVAMLLHSVIFSLLVAPQYRAISYLLPWVLLAGGLVAAGQVLTLKLMSEMNTKALLLPKIATSVGGVALNFAGAAFWGLQGVVGASVVFSVLQFAWFALRTKSPPARSPTLVTE